MLQFDKNDAKMALKMALGSSTKLIQLQPSPVLSQSCILTFVCSIAGLSGAGKSTLLNTLTGRIQANAGTVTLNDLPVSRQLRRKISYVMQQDIFYPSLTLKETLTVGVCVTFFSTTPANESNLEH